MPELDRRDFLRLVGASAGAAAAAGCSDPVEKLIPYVIQPEVITPGIPDFYASTCRECAAGCGLHVKTREARPIKLEGNPDHPINKGSLCARGQAGIGRTYHPDRYAGPLVRKGDALVESSWEEARGQVAQKLRGSGSKTWFFGGDQGPTINAIVDDVLGKVQAGGRIVYEPFAHESLRSATELVFGAPVLPIFDLSEADLVVDLGADSLDTGISPTEHARQLADSRDPVQHPDGGARLVAVSPRATLTSSNADVWIPAAPGSEGEIALALAKLVHAKRGAGRVPGDTAAVAKAVSAGDPAAAASRAGIERSEIEALADRLVAAKSPVVLPPGVAAAGTNGVATAAAVLVLNAVLGAMDAQVKLPARVAGVIPSSFREIQKLVAAMKRGAVDVLIIDDSNPVYSLPTELGFAEALEKVGMVVSLASLANETSERADVVLPSNTSLESWGDVEARLGVRSLVQPTIRPLHDTQALGDTFLALGREAGVSGLPDGDVRSVLESAWEGQNFRHALARGGSFGDTPLAGAVVSSKVGSLAVKAPEIKGSGDLTLVAYPHSFLGDGRGAALPWMQEIPDPVTKAAWQSWAEVSNSTAEKLGVGFGDVVAIETGVGRIDVPVYPRGGVRDDIIAVAIGQGHTVGLFASMENDGQPGVARGANVISVLPVATDEQGGRAWLTTRASVSSTGGFSRIPISQWTDNQRGRGLAKAVPLAALAKDAHAEGEGGDHHDDPFDHNVIHLAEGLARPYEISMDAAPDSEYRWALTIDNDRCNGCSACIAACYTENNVPIVGQDGVTRHREMTWLRIERWVGEGDTEGGEERRPHPHRDELGGTDVRHVPMLCQQCGAAPCESVCPVIATYHSPDGLNGMIYNRCVGTRYCANNCVYKVRRFNYFDYSQFNWPGLMDLMLNPDVTVRGQGVMEKCSFCVQRIQTARQPAKDEGRPIAEGEVQTACQQACPTRAITFGNSRDPESEVNKQAAEPARAYHSLQTLNARPAITYLAKVDRESSGSDKSDHHERSH